MVSECDVSIKNESHVDAWMSAVSLWHVIIQSRYQNSCVDTLANENVCNMKTFPVVHGKFPCCLSIPTSKSWCWWTLPIYCGSKKKTSLPFYKAADNVKIIIVVAKTDIVAAIKILLFFYFRNYFCALITVGTFFYLTLLQNKPLQSLCIWWVHI